jgi:hypothetical protein
MREYYATLPGSSTSIGTVVLQSRRPEFLVHHPSINLWMFRDDCQSGAYLLVELGMIDSNGRRYCTVGNQSVTARKASSGFGSVKESVAKGFNISYRRRPISFRSDDV